jgi:hypothetical protein
VNIDLTVPHISNLRIARSRIGEKANKTRASWRFPKIVIPTESSLCRHREKNPARMRKHRLLTAERINRLRLLVFSPT